MFGKDKRCNSDKCHCPRCPPAVADIIVEATNESVAAIYRAKQTALEDIRSRGRCERALNRIDRATYYGRKAPHEKPLDFTDRVFAAAERKKQLNRHARSLGYTPPEATMLSALELSMLLFKHLHPGQAYQAYPTGDSHQSLHGAYNTLKSNGLIARSDPSEYYTVTERGRVLIAAACKLPLPIRADAPWVMPA